jgi:outer membrane protein assembly factor BamA
MHKLFFLLMVRRSKVTRIIINIFALNTYFPLLKHFRIYSIIQSFIRFLIFTGLIAVVFSCNPTKYVLEGESLLNENHIIINKEGVTKSDIVPYIKQQPNKRIFGTRFHLGLYNLSNLEKEKWPHSWLRNIGEEPVKFDIDATLKSKEQIKSYVASKGYFDGKVVETVETANKKTDVFYNIDLLPPYKVRHVFYEIADSNIKNLWYFDSSSCMIERGKAYDVDILQAERSRFERFVKDQGFYNFSGDHIFFRIDSTVGNRQVDIYYGIKNFTRVDQYNQVSQEPHSIYRVKNVYIYSDFDPKQSLERGSEYLNSLDTTEYKGYYFIGAPGKPAIKYDLILQALYLKPAGVFNVTNTDQSESHLFSLKAFRLVNISYSDLDASRPYDGKERSLNCNIQMTRLSKQSFNVELEGTNSSGNLGGAINFIYQNKNLFHGAEIFNIKLKGAYEALAQKDTLLSTKELGFEASLRLPVFLLPFVKTDNFIKKYNPTTIILASYNYQAMPFFYTRNMANATFGYNWKAGSYQEHFVNPLLFNLVKLPYINPTWAAQIDSSSYLASSYKDVMILGGSYSFIFNNQKINKSRDYWFLRINAEAAGNMLSSASKLSGAKKTDDAYHFLGQQYAQYIRTDFDLRYNYVFNDVSSIVYRGFLGIGVPYGNSKAIPFSKQYFGGGANGIRAWQVRSLGPGTYKPPESSFLNQTADIMLEFNAEYRFKLFWILEGAVFVDAGNIWTYNYDDNRPGSQFSMKNFYKELAVGTGTGFRFDFSFVIARVDIGMKLRDPMATAGSNWIFLDRPYNLHNDFTVVLGIGYPF